MSHRVYLAAIGLAGVAACADGPTGAAPSYTWIAEDVATIRAPLVVLDNAVVRVTMYRDAVQFSSNGMAHRSANMVQFDKASGDTTILTSLVSEPYESDGARIRIRRDGVCLGILACPSFEEGRLVGDTLYLPSRFANFRTIRYRRHPTLLD